MIGVPCNIKVLTVDRVHPPMHAFGRPQIGVNEKEKKNDTTPNDYPDENERLSTVYSVTKRNNILRENISPISTDAFPR